MVAVVVVVVAAVFGGGGGGGGSGGGGGGYGGPSGGAGGTFCWCVDVVVLVLVLEFLMCSLLFPVCLLVFVLLACCIAIHSRSRCCGFLLIIPV